MKSSFISVNVLVLLPSFAGCFHISAASHFAQFTVNHKKRQKRQKRQKRRLHEDIICQNILTFSTLQAPGLAVCPLQDVLTSLD